MNGKGLVSFAFFPVLQAVGLVIIKVISKIEITQKEVKFLLFEILGCARINCILDTTSFFYVHQVNFISAI